MCTQMCALHHRTGGACSPSANELQQPQCHYAPPLRQIQRGGLSDPPLLHTENSRSPLPIHSGRPCTVNTNFLQVH